MKECLKSWSFKWRRERGIGDEAVAVGQIVLDRYR